MSERPRNLLEVLFKAGGSALSSIPEHRQQMMNENIRKQEADWRSKVFNQTQSNWQRKFDLNKQENANSTNTTIKYQTAGLPRNPIST